MITPVQSHHPRATRAANGAQRPASALPPEGSATRQPGTFAALGLGPRSLEAVQRAGFRTPTEVQELFIPAALTGRDCVGRARTGTGKTAAFLLPLFERFFRGAPLRALILAPTRELAIQIGAESQRLSGHRPPRATVVYGGTPINPQIRRLRGEPEVVVATPGRLLDHAQRRTIDLSAFPLVVLDEVDRMFDMGFRRDISTILRRCTRRAQSLFLSATLPPDILRLAERFLRDPIRVSAVDEEQGPSVEALEQRYFAVMPHRKQPLLFEVLKREEPELCLVFTRTKRGAERLGQALQRRGLQAAYLHGGLTQGHRGRALEGFRTRQVPLLVATDVMGRGIDVPGISHVINYDIPENPKDYLHRVGRSGRMNAAGKAFTFVTPSQADEINAIEAMCRRLLERDAILGFDNGISRR